MSSTPLRVLFVEDSEDDVVLLLRELRRGGFAPEYQRVDAAHSFTRALQEQDWQLILSDYAMPSFSGLDALHLLLRTKRDIPFILISGTVGEEVAVESMRAGANDYLMKHTLTRLVPAIQRELRDAEERRQHRRAEEELREHQRLLALVYNHTSEMLGLFRVQPNGGYRMVSVNRPWLQFAAKLGLTLTEAQWSELELQAVVQQGFPSAAGVSISEERFQTALLRGQPVSFAEKLDRPEARYFTEQSLVPLAGLDGAGRYLLWACRDLTERYQQEEQRRLLEQQLAEAQKLEALGTLAGGIAHDFNNLLTGILGYAELIKNEAVGMTSVLEHLAQILNAGQRARDLVRQILTFSRRQTPARQSIQLPQIVRETYQFLRAGLPPHIQVELRMVDEMPPILGDPSQLHQVIMNLCTNAIQAIGERSGRLTIGVEALELVDEEAQALPPLRPGRHVRLRVEDNGSGMSSEVLARIYEPFFTTKPPGVGTGLGLPVVHGVVQNHDGAIRVQSVPGSGTTFELFFPAAPHPNTLTATTRTGPKRGRGQRVLFLDDQPNLVRLATTILQRLGYEPVAFSDPVEALAAFRAAPQQFDVAFTDMSMPLMNGLEFAQELRRLRPDLPVICTSGKSVIEPESLAELGESVYRIEKPFALQSIGEVLADALSGRRQ